MMAACTACGQFTEPLSTRTTSEANVLRLPEDPRDRAWTSSVLADRCVQGTSSLGVVNMGVQATSIVWQPPIFSGRQEIKEMIRSRRSLVAERNWGVPRKAIEIGSLGGSPPAVEHVLVSSHLPDPRGSQSSSFTPFGHARTEDVRHGGGVRHVPDLWQLSYWKQRASEAFGNPKSVWREGADERHWSTVDPGPGASSKAVLPGCLNVDPAWTPRKGSRLSRARAGGVQIQTPISASRSMSSDFPASSVEAAEISGVTAAISLGMLRSDEPDGGGEQRH
ncbi:hypothetical protein Purlil1_9866 [Purpureocillium lilacinum]|uniref:Uncharacterized protein n=1 Tax=Purpureocillium lilacinum TaxID=33203 RepID=A0ABR0BNU7_PURLI|nr:hypothetical protein Purlil1_9866 [Purpureocillium lilacinum]